MEQELQRLKEQDILEKVKRLEPQQLDAMQLAAMKKLGGRVITYVYCADRPFGAVVEEEGFSVINPEQPPETEAESGE